MLAGEALDEKGDTAGAIDMFRKAAKAKPNEPDVHFGLGYLLFKQKQYPEAIKEFQAELANDPNHAQSLLYMGDAYIQMNQYADAAPPLEKAVKLDPSIALVHLDLGILAATDGRNDDALREFLIAEKLNPDDVNVHWRLGRLYRTMGRKEEAKIELDKASNITRSANQELYREDLRRSGQAPSRTRRLLQGPRTNATINAADEQRLARLNLLSSKPRRSLCRKKLERALSGHTCCASTCSSSSFVSTAVATVIKQ